MTEVQKIPFKSIHNLREWRQSKHARTFEEEWLDTVLIPGMESHFKSSNPLIHIYEITELNENTLYADVHIELKGKDGEIHQPWILTFICEKGIETLQEMGQMVTYSTLETLEDPFPGEDILWDCEFFTKETLVEAMYEWSKTFWPDFNPTFKFGMITDQFQWIRNLLENTDLQAYFGEGKELPSDLKQFIEADLFIVGTKKNVGIEFMNWLESQKCPAVEVKNDEFAALLTPEIKKEIEIKWPSISLRPAFDLED